MNEQEVKPVRNSVQVPSIGRIVHYVTKGMESLGYPGDEHRAAIITSVYTEQTKDSDEASQWIDGLVSLEFVALCVLSPTGLYFEEVVKYDPNGAPGTWHWPEHVNPRER